MSDIATDTKKVRVYCLSLAVLTLFLVGLGGFVRATGAGLACPDWPLCFGRVVPEIAKAGVFQEVFHRFVASLVTVLTLLLSIFVYRRRALMPRLWKLCFGLLVLLAAQIILGGLTVLMKLNPFIVTGHLALGTVFLLLVTLVAIERPRPAPLLTAGERRFRTLIGFISLLCFAQILLGGFVGSSGAAMACPDIPFCFGEVLPENASGPQYIQMLHRGTGILLSLLVLLAFIKAGRAGDAVSAKRGHLIGMLNLIIIQIVLGFSNVALGIPVSVTVLHLVVAQMLLIGLTMLYKNLNPSLRILPIVEGADATSITNPAEQRRVANE